MGIQLAFYLHQHINASLNFDTVSIHEETKEAVR